MKDKRNTIQFSENHPIIDLDCVEAIEIINTNTFGEFTTRFYMKTGAQIDVIILSKEVEPSPKMLDEIAANPDMYACKKDHESIFRTAQIREFPEISFNFYNRACQLMTHGRYIGEARS